MNYRILFRPRGSKVDWTKSVVVYEDIETAEEKAELWKDMFKDECKVVEEKGKVYPEEFHDPFLPTTLASLPYEDRLYRFNRVAKLRDNKFYKVRADSIA